MGNQDSLVLEERALVEQFESCTLPPERWTHRAHLTIARSFLLEDDYDVALARFRKALRRYNETIDMPESLTRGYHETVTEAWFRIIASLIDSRGPGESSEAFFEEHPFLLCRQLLRLFYTGPRLVSLRAKHQWVAPDLVPLERPGG